MRTLDTVVTKATEAKRMLPSPHPPRSAARHAKTAFCISGRDYIYVLIKYVFVAYSQRNASDDAVIRLEYLRNKNQKVKLEWHFCRVFTKHQFNMFQSDYPAHSSLFFRPIACAGAQLMSLQLPLLIGCLGDDVTSPASPLHQLTLQLLLEVGPKHPGTSLDRM
jgi:hypothetical protein